ncbi:uncharacterized protein CPUR_08425 [Claviceps purpurea 20.1]|uniref:Uncharacterized protein n=1 Tax=Claviceps purpurea (strain 20.1) TaxID=1111077 RepID=M1WGF7_CLAP2|nr:hypothetical protein E4U36_006235 [Claviceps purpurea]KAG6216555.1 hypothetical protein E4U50_005591 [Claviceps purpurea]CCE34493.1 uncharacterized protein CPUR_08425 [Claviceps purpurea 20.1]
MPVTKPKLEKLSTPLTATFPSEISSASASTPLSARPFPRMMDPDFLKTPISPPAAYAEFLSKAMAMNSPSVVLGDLSLDFTKSNSEDENERVERSPKRESVSPASTPSSKQTPSVSASALPRTPLPTSSPSCKLIPDTVSASSSALPRTPLQASISSSKQTPHISASSLPRTPLPTATPSCKPPRNTVSVSVSASALPRTPLPTSAPMSAPPNIAATFPSFKLPPSPAFSSVDSPLSANTTRSNPSARASRPVFDWEAALEAHAADKRHKTSRTSIRHIREVVTRTVTYIPRMEPAPRGKRRREE